jgi:hypothetical protein
MPVTPADMTDEQHALIERLAHRCPHQPEPCQACTNLAVGAVTTLVECGWWAQIDHYHNRPSSTPKEPTP